MESVVDEKKNRRIAASGTIGLHAALLVFFFFVVGWRAPDPPLGELGYAINLGFSDEGSGDVQPDQPVGVAQAQATPEVQPEETQQLEQNQQTVAPEEQPEEQLVSNDETAVPVSDVKKKEEPVKKPEPVKDKTDSKEANKEPVKPAAVYNPNAKKGTDTQVGQPGGEGDDINKTGDKGQPDGSPGPGLYKGKVGGGGGTGPGLSLDGWLWDEMPNVKPPGNESSGRIVFQIKVNEDGEIIDIKTLERSLSLEMEKLCRREIEKLTFSKIGTNVPAVSTGKITFVVLSN